MISLVRIGSRGSALALWQSNYVKDMLEAIYPQLQVTIDIIQTKGDRVLDTPLSNLGGKGAFTKEIENALLRRTVDIAVHSLKDLPTLPEAELTIAAIPKRAPVEDVFLTKNKTVPLLELPNGATIATGSLRRKAQLLNRRPDFQIVDIRGNVPTRIQKMLSSEWSGVVLARAGVERLGLVDYVSETIPLEWILPAAGQGAIAIQCRTSDNELREILAALNDHDSSNAVIAERTFLEKLGGGCQAPIGAHAVCHDGILDLTGCVTSLDGRSTVRAIHSGKSNVPEEVGAFLATTLLESGATDILNEILRHESASLSEEKFPLV